MAHSKSRRLAPRHQAMALAIAACFPCAALAQTGGGLFMGIGTLGGSYSYLSNSSNSRSISADGTVVSGYAAVPGDSSHHAFRWTLSGGMEDLGTLGGSYSYPRAISLDGSTIVGDSRLSDDSANRAFRWTAAGGMVDLGTLGGTYSYARDVSADGAVVVGESYLSGDSAQRAFRWTQADGMVNLGTLGGSHSYAYAVSADGGTVVGSSYENGDSSQTAFRWTSVGGMQSLGTLGGTYSYGYGTSADGSVVVGQSHTSGNSQYHAFRWTQADGMVDLGTLGGTYSYVAGLNLDGSVVIGHSNTAGDSTYNAFRWTQAEGMQNLGTLGGSYSYATDLSANGDVVVGWAQVEGNASNEAFRWTASGGMQSVRNWLQSNGVSVAEGWRLADGGEVSTNTTGDIVVGSGVNPDGIREVWFARSTGAVTLDDVIQGLSETASAGHSIQAATSTVLNGAHSRPLDRRVPAGQKTVWLAGDWGTDDHGVRNGTLGLAELGLGINLGSVQLNAALGQTWARQDLTLNGHAHTDGTYLLAEALIPVSGKLWATLGGYVLEGDAEVRRGYLNAGTADASTGSSNVGTWGLRARLEWDNAYQLGSAEASPYVDLSFARTRVGGYTETGGGFPARFDARKDNATELRAGVNLSKPLSGDMRLLGTLEVAHRFERQGAGSSGEVIGLFAFDLDGVRNQRSWVRGGLGVSGRMGGGQASVTLNLTSQGEAPSAWLGLRWQKAF